MSFAGRSWYKFYLAVLLVHCTAFYSASAQSIHSTIKLTIRETLERVQQNLPQLESYRQQALAARGNIALAKNSLMPDLTAGYQANMATINNITGMSYPGFLLPISGPPSAGNEMNFVPGTALGALIKWEPFSFGQRNAAIEKATAQFTLANATFNEQLFRHQYAALTVYLEALYLKRINDIAASVIERYRVGLQQSLVLAKNGIKAGIDTAQFQSAIMQAEIDFLQTEKNYLQKLTELTRLTGITENAGSVVLMDTTFKQIVAAEDSLAINLHPYYQAMEAQKNNTAASLRQIQHSWVPRLDIWGNLYARGSGALANRTINKAKGWQLSRTNAGIGLQLSFPVLDFSKVNLRKRQHHALLKSDEAKLSQARLDIMKQVENATLQYSQDTKIAGKTPQQLKIAQSVYEGLKVSYEAGLIDYTRLYQSQYELSKAELTDASAQLQLWRSLLSLAVAKGNLALFVDQLN